MGACAAKAMRASITTVTMRTTATATITMMMITRTTIATTTLMIATTSWSVKLHALEL